VLNEELGEHCVAVDVGVVGQHAPSWNIMKLVPHSLLWPDVQVVVLLPPESGA